MVNSKFRLVMNETETSQQNPTRPRDFRLLLQQELVRRCEKNPRYSLRSFAKHLSIHPSTLSALLRGRRPFSRATREHLAQKLGLDPTALASEDTYQQLTLDAFALISDWYHYAIIQLVRVKDFRPDRAWIARALDISVSEVNIAVERLCRLELLQITEDGKWILSEAPVTTVGNPFTHAAFRKLQQQILTGAITAMEQVPIERRDQSSMTMAIDSRRLPEAREKIKKFRRELCDYLQAGEECDEVYQMSVALYPVTDIQRSKS